VPAGNSTVWRRERLGHIGKGKRYRSRCSAQKKAAPEGAARRL